MRAQEILRPLAVIAALALCLPQMTSAEEPVRFGDVNLKAVVEATLDTTNPTPADMLTLVTLKADSKGIADLTGLEYATNLTNLDLGDNQISDISPLASLRTLEWLRLHSNWISDLSPLASLENLGYLDVSENPLNEQACTEHIPEILRNNPGINLQYDPCVDAEAGQHVLTVLCGEGGTISTEAFSGGSYRMFVGPVSAALSDGAEVTVKAVARAGWRFTGWIGTTTSIESTFTFTLTSDQRLAAHFTLDPAIPPVTLTVTCGEGGTVTRPGVGSFSYERGTAVLVEAVVSPGYRFAGWTGTVVDRKEIADPGQHRIRVVANENGTLRANFEAIRSFRESWETSALATYVPARATFIHGDEGAWLLEDAIAESRSCGPTPQRAEILKLDGGQALLLTSADSGSTCSDIVSVSLIEAGLVNPGFALAVDANTVLSFYEVGQLDHPELRQSKDGCRVPPCFDNVSLLLSDNKGNVLAYVLQRSPDAVANIPNANVRDTYREIFLDRTGVYYRRRLLNDLRTIPAFDPAGAQVRSVEFRVDEHASAIIDEVTIQPGAIDGTTPVYRFWSPVLESHFFTTGADEKQTLIDLFSSIWTFEGIAYFTLTDGSKPGAVPVYRFWSPTFSSHFYTISEDEKSTLLKDFPDVWTLEGVAFYAFPEGRQPADACPVYRFWSGTLGCHFYTTSEAERDNLVSNFPQVWTLEGVAWYAYPPQWDSGQALGIVRDRRTSKNP